VVVSWCARPAVIFRNSLNLGDIIHQWGAMEAIPYLSAFITIVRAVRDLYRRFRKDEEAEAIEKAASAVESNPNAEADEVRQTFERTLNQQLGEERAKPVIQYTNLVETFFPVRPRGRVLHYGLAAEQLILEIHRSLQDLDAFKLWGLSHDSNRTLSFPQTANSIYGQGLTRDVISGDEVYGLDAFLFEMPHGILGGPKARFKLTLHDYLVLRMKRSGKDNSKKDPWIFVRADDGFPFSLTFETSLQSSERRLQHYEFEHLVNSLISDANQYHAKVSDEFDRSQRTVERFASAMKALKDLSNMSPPD